jgi:glycosyltransferase involved in cell wall biosynthesis
MRIILVAPTYLPSRRANTVQVMKMAQALTSLGHQVRVLVPGGGLDDRHPDWGELAHHYGLRHRFSVEWLPTRMNFRGYDYGFKAVREAQLWKADLLYTRLPQAGAFASNLGVGTVLEVHDLPQGKLGPWLLRRFLRGRGARRLVLISQSLQEDLARVFGVPVEPPFALIAPDGVDLERYQDVPSPPEAREALSADRQIDPPLPVDGFIAGYSGHLYQGRGVKLILALAARMPQVTFLLAGGETGEVERLRDQIKKDDLTNVRLIGFVPNAVLPRYQAACDVLLMPYQRYVAASSGGDIARYLSPMKLFEYLACGRAILSSDLPVLQEVLNQWNALLLPAEDVDAWVVALQALMADPGLRNALARQAREDALEYTWTGRARRILDGL